MVVAPLRLTKTKTVVSRCEGVAAASPASLVGVVFFLFMLFDFTDNSMFGRWIVFAEGNSGGGAVKSTYSSAGFWLSAVAPSNVGLAVAVTAMAGLAAVAITVVYSRRGSLRSPWSRRRRKFALEPNQWNGFFTEEGRLNDGGIKFLKKVRSGGVDPSIRSEVWPFLLGVYDLNSTSEERKSIQQQKQKEYESLREQCLQIQKRYENSCQPKDTTNSSNTEDDSSELSQVVDSHDIVKNADDSIKSIHIEDSEHSNSETSVQDEDFEKSDITSEDVFPNNSDSINSASEQTEISPLLPDKDIEENNDNQNNAHSTPSNPKKSQTDEDFITWQRIIRLDAVRANDEWMPYSPSQAAVSETDAMKLATKVDLKDYDHLEPCRILHAARLVSILEAYAVYDPEIGYCQGMSDLLSPLIAVIEDDVVAFWCFVGFMAKARHNFRLDEVGIRRQLSLVSKIIKFKDNHLYRHLENLQAEDCFFVYRMVVVLFRRELTFDQTLCLWEVMWADQAAIRAGIAKATWSRIRLRAPPTEDLLLYAIAASVLQRRKTIIEKYSGMDEIMRECNSMAGHLDVWKLLDDAHDLVVNLHNKI